MKLYVVYQILLLAGGLLFAAAVVYIGYKWGVFAALQALAQNSPKWKAYALALIPPTGFALSLLFDCHLSAFASQTFCALATPAMIGTCFKYNRASYSPF